MSDSVNESAGAGPSQRNAEIGVAVAMAILALIGIYGSYQVGFGWGDDGPRAGFFPFYVSLIVLISCAVNISNVFRHADDRGKVFAESLCTRSSAKRNCWRFQRPGRRRCRAIWTC